jgi:hypothetical protein
MGFCMTCSKTGISCSYSRWFEIRVEIIKMTIKYLEEKLVEVENALKNQEENPTGDETVDDYYEGIWIHDFPLYVKKLQKEIIEPIQKIMNNDNFDKDTKHMGIYRIIEFIDMMKITMKEALVCFGVYGLYSLCKVSDCGGFYSVGESMDIVQLLNLVKPYLDISSEYEFSIIYTRNTDCSSIYDIFHDSITTIKPIRIT